MATEPRTTEKKAQDYEVMGHSVVLINIISNGSDPSYKENLTAEELKNSVSRNVEHLETMVAREDWGSEDMAPSEAAIIKGKAYVAS
tara:strand:+ start:213 stop:473 length:261 start_codon:yes stop_codon:yes gene_type:complete